MVLSPLVLVLAACLPPAAEPTFNPWTGGGSSGPRVAISGDSLLNSAREENLQLLTPAYRVSQFGQGTRGLHDLQGHIAAVARSRPDVYVLAIGNCDIKDGPSRFIPWIEQALDATADVPVVLWVNVIEDGLNYYHPNWATWARQFNAELRRQDALRTNLRVLDWNARARANPSWIWRDGLHLTASGQWAYANLIRWGVRTSQSATAAATSSG